MDFENKVLNILGEILQRVTNLEQDVAILKKDVAILKEDVAILKEDVAVLKEDVVALKGDVFILKQDVSLLKTKVYLMDENLNDLKDKFDELKEDHVYLSQTVAKIEFESDNKFKTLFDYIEVNRADHQRLEDLINSKISEDRIFFKTILDKHDERITTLESAKIS